jgi:hypothetical protein
VPGIRRDAVHQLFQQFGPTAQVSVRCSTGLFVSNTAVPNETLSENDRHYATVQYLASKSAKRALALNDREIDGFSVKGRKLIVRTLIVSSSVVALYLSNRCLYLPLTSLKPTKVRVHCALFSERRLM